MTSSASADRRKVLGLLLGAPVVTTAPLAAAATEAQPAPSGQMPGTCRLLPQAVEGPYYFDPGLVRRDMRDGRPGLPMTLSLRVIDAVSCRPLDKARVDVWHADAGGVYSGYAGQGDTREVSTKGQTYLRATQFADAAGDVRFDTIYPGWYPGRTPHIHVKVFLDKRTVATAQVYFPDALSQRIYATQAPYKARPTPDTSNATDGIFRSGERDGGGTVLAIEEGKGPMVASLLVAVDTTGKAAAGGWRRWMPPWR